MKSQAALNYGLDEQRHTHKLTTEPKSLRVDRQRNSTQIDGNKAYDNSVSAPNLHENRNASYDDIN